ncbi:Hint domain-containing protein [Methylobacterium organophilum]|uniref:Hedgehog/Intein (Hint) domain-containing protein n=1 Tax=Methylobacterium organophilum TaxID=410 RepID=A0ABQ4T1I1_METOR|nr:Hint domain-containing protein [Methylobacterium organophilum]GJE25497.1 hypothetical protein LKMONMHP_0335 [Methylobacterium organophilum]
MAQTIPSGSQSSTYSITTPDTYTLNAGETRTQTSGIGIQANVSSGTTTIDIEGTLNDTASGARAIRANIVSGRLVVGTNGRVQSLNGDAVQAQSATGRFDVANGGQIISASSMGTPTVGGSNPGTGFALNFNAVTGAANAPATDFTSGGVITNGAADNTAALIRSDSGDAIRLGSHQTLVNYGTINGNGPVNDSSTNNSFNQTGNTSTAQTYDVSRGVRINQNGATSDRIDNYGTITGSQHGVDVGQTNVTGLVVNNVAGGQIIGRNGSGVGSDTTGAAANTVTVTNSGLIRGAYAPAYDRAGYRTVDGDGDGVDVDGGATITNNAGSVIEGTGAGGYDSNGRLNNSEGISIGGGVITNDGTIRGAAYGIVVNNDSNTDGSRSGVAATSIVNGASGQISGENGYAIRLENKTGNAAIDNDTIVNAGTITGNGTIPTGTVLRQDGSADPGTVGTLDGTGYTTADAGSARFIRGDGSAIQTGEGSDTLSNYGTITGNTGRAINLEGGDDTLNLYTGSSVSGRIDGGAGTDTLNLRLDDRPATAASGSGSLGANSGATTGTLANVVNVEKLAVQGGSWTIQDMQAYGAGIAIDAHAGLTVGAGGSLAGTVANAGTLTFAHRGDLAMADTISGQGSLVQAGSGALTLSGANSYSGGTTIQSGNLTLAAAGAAGTGAIAFPTLTGEATARLTLTAAAQPNAVTFANTIANFGTGSELDLAGLTDARVSFNASSSLLTVAGTSGGNAITQSYRFSGAASTAFTTRSDGNGGTLITVCFTTGTRIQTRRGAVPVEALRVGDQAVTASGGLRPIIWIGHRDLDGAGEPLHHDQQPIRIRKGAFGRDAEGRPLPARALFLSPGHPVLVGADADNEGGVLVPIMCLINGTSIARLAAPRVTYWHVELDAHDILLAEGLPAESYLDGGNRLFFTEGSDHALHNPDFVPPGWNGRCRPVAVDGPLVEAERARLGAVFAAELTGHCGWVAPESWRGA